MAQREVRGAGARLEAGTMREIVFRAREGKVEMRQARVPERGEDEVLVRTAYVGIDGTDEEIVSGGHGDAPEGEDHIILGHECLGVVQEAPEDSELAAGDLVVPLVRHGCGDCPACEHDASDMCPTHEFEEHGIEGMHGFMRDYWTDDPMWLVKAPNDLGRLAVLAEPFSINVKALEHMRTMQRNRIPWFDEDGGFSGKRALLAGTGSLGTLGAFLLLHEGMDVWAMDKTPDDAFGPRLLADVGVHHVNAEDTDIRQVAEDVGGFDLVIEATGVPQVAFNTLHTLARNGIMCMLGVPPEKPPFDVEGSRIMRDMVNGNQVLLGSVNSNRAHFRQSLDLIHAFRDRWGGHFESLITHTYTPDQYEEALHPEDPDLVKRVMHWSDIEEAMPRG